MTLEAVYDFCVLASLTERIDLETERLLLQNP